jgi:calcium-dependent protein kinase
VGDVKSKYKFKKKLGQGGFGTVYLCHLRTDVKPNYNYYAVKSIRKDNVENQESFKTEVEIARKIDHPNIVKLYETWESEVHYYLVFEYCQGGELLDFI